MFSCSPHRGKLAEWLASKGKTLKRPTMSTTSKTKVSANPKSDLKPQPEPATQCEIQPNEEAHETEAAAAATTHSADKPGTEIMTLNLSPDPPLEPQDSVDDVSRTTGWASVVVLAKFSSIFIIKMPSF